MSTIRPAQMTNDPFSVWANSIQDGLNEQKVSVSSDFIQKDGPSGKFISLHPKNKYVPNYTTYQGEWSPTSSYNVNDVVRVLPGKNYLAKPYINWTAGPSYITSPIPLPPLNNSFRADKGNVMVGKIEFIKGIITDVIMGNYYPVPGTYICVSFVPGLDMQAAMVTSANISEIVGSYDDTYNVFNDPRFAANINYMRMNDVNYFPCWPEKPNIGYVDNLNLGMTDGRYWELISLLPSQIRVCTGGSAVSSSFADVAFIPSGSANYTGSI